MLTCVRCAMACTIIERSTERCIPNVVFWLVTESKIVNWLVTVLEAYKSLSASVSMISDCGLTRVNCVALVP